MPPTTRQLTQGTSAALNQEIDQALGLMQQIEELSAQLDGRKEAIRKMMKTADLDRFATAAGHEALLAESINFIWTPEKLERVLDDEQFEDLCPRKPDSNGLRKLFEAAPEDLQKKLAACKRNSKSTRLHLRSATAPGSGE